MIYVPRERWGAPPRPGGSPIGPVSTVAIHHSYRPHVDAGAGPAAERRATYGVWGYHVNDKGWSDIGYQWLVYQSGAVHEGRGWRRSGAHEPAINSTSAAICLVIDGDTYTPTVAAWRACEAVVRDGLDGGHIRAGYDVVGHRDFSPKSCPGDRTYPHIGRLAGLDEEDDVTNADIDRIAEEVVERLTNHVPKADYGQPPRSVDTLLVQTHRAVTDDDGGK